MKRCDILAESLFRNNATYRKTSIEVDQQKTKVDICMLDDNLPRET